jgi:hypothetical protein
MLTCSVVACPANAAGAPSCVCNSGFGGTLSYSAGVWSGTCTSTGAVWQSTYNNARVRSFVYSGGATTLTWTLQHNICAANGKLTPGSNNPSYLNQYCSYSPSDNWVVTSSCNWALQGFTWVSGTVAAGTTAYMCAHANCDHISFVTGTTLSYVYSTRTLFPGDSVFCSP